MRSALSAVAIKIDNTDYINLSSTQKLELAGLFLDMEDTNRTSYDTEAGYVDSGDINTDVNTIWGMVYEETTGALIYDVNNALTNSDVNDALTALDYTPYADLSAGDKLLVSEKFLEGYPTNDSGDYVANNYNTLSAIYDDIDAAIEAIQ